MRSLRPHRSTLVLVLALVGCASAHAEDAWLSRWVDPLIGTGPSDSPNPVPGGAGGSTIPGAMVPFGMVQWSPDTDKASPSGYGYAGTRIEGFSLTHFNGAGCPNGEDIGILPFAGPITSSPGVAWKEYASTFSHIDEDEQALPGFYRVNFFSGIEVELTATMRTAMARFSYPSGDPSLLLINPSRNATGEREASLHIEGTRITGSAIGGGFCGSDATIPIYFVIELERPPLATGTWLGDVVTKGATDVRGVRAGAWLEFDRRADDVVLMKVAISYVDLEHAMANLAAESPNWDFDDVRMSAFQAWEGVLTRVRIEGASKEDRVKFYTAFYHVFSNPNVFNDVGGDYRGFDGAVHHADGWTNYQNFSGWDIIRSWTHLVSAIAPEGPDIMRSMVQGGVEAGLLPFWTDRNMETQVMVGDPGTVNVANAQAMGVAGFDREAALALMVRSATDPAHTQRYGLDEWITRHHVRGNAATTLEYAMADFALAQYAASLGRTDLHEEYLLRSAYWKESWNESDGYIEPIGEEDSAARIYEVEVYAPPASGAPGDFGPNLALHRRTTASGECNPNESSDKAVNGSVSGGNSDKWCDNSSEHKWWRVDLGSRQSVARFVISHAAAGGETSDWNTRDFTIQVSDDDASWTDVVTVKGNRDSITVHEIRPVDARYVRLNLSAADDEDGWGCQPFDAASGCGFIEGNGAQYVWLVPHDMQGLIGLMGGRDAAIARLDQLFTELNAGTNRPFFYIGNEPEHGTPWVYNFAGAPDKTRDVVRRIIDQEFDTTAGGLPGNDDLGATSAWLVWAYLGLYPAIPGTDIFALHGPCVPAASVRLANGKELRIETENYGAPYVGAVTLNDAPLTRAWIHWSEVAQGGTLRYSMSTTASASWGRSPAELPPSFSPR